MLVLHLPLTRSLPLASSLMSDGKFQRYTIPWPLTPHFRCSMLYACLPTPLRTCSSGAQPFTGATFSAHCATPCLLTWQVTVHPRSQREPVPLSIHHLPIAVSLALFKVRTLTCTPCLAPALPPVRDILA